MNASKVLLLGAFLCLIGGAVANAAEQLGYDALVAQLRSGDTSIDFRALRYARAELADHDPYGLSVNAAKREMFNALGADDFDKAATAATEIVERDYTDSDAHAVLGLIHERRGERDRAQFERTVARGLYRSIVDSGDGKTPETAFVVIAISEEYIVLREHGLERVRQALLQTARGPVDMLDGVDPRTGMHQSLYFDVNRVFARRRNGWETP